MSNFKFFALFLGVLAFKVEATPVPDDSTGYAVMNALAQRTNQLNSGLNMFAALTSFSSNDDCHRFQAQLPQVRQSITAAYGNATSLATLLNQVYQTVRSGCLSTNVINDTVCLTGQAVVVKNAYVQDKDTYVATATDVSTAVKVLGSAFVGCLNSL